MILTLLQFLLKTERKKLLNLNSDFETCSAIFFFNPQIEKLNIDSILFLVALIDLIK